MNDIDAIVRKLEAIYSSRQKLESIDPPLPQKVEFWMSYSKSYLSAAETVEKESPQHWLPVRQLLGQSVELALKACILAAKESHNIDHNLINSNLR